MSIILQTLTAGNLAASGGTTQGTTGTVNPSMPFAQTLVQSMGGVTTAKGTETPVAGNLASLLQGLLSAVQAKGEEAGSTDVKQTKLLEGLVQDIEKLDTSLEADPALIAALQSWLLQVSALVSGNPSPGSQDASATVADTSISLSPLAKNPETLRFAIQDELNSLVQRVQIAAVSGDQETAAKGAALLNQFSAIMAESAPVNHKSMANKTPAVVDAPAVSLKQATESEPRVGMYSKGDLATDVRRLLGASASTGSMLNAAAVAGNSEAVTAPEGSTPIAAVVTATLKETVSAEDPLLSGEGTTQEPEVVTAGQLSLRHGITAPLKAEAAPVPVQQFAQEMNTFISGKLEIVKKGGVAEATITLFPENLGQVDVKITMQNGNLVAQFMTQHAGTKDMLEQQMSQLRLALQSQGLQVERLEVTQNNNSPQSQWTGGQGQQAGAGGQQQGRRSRDHQEESADAVLAAELNGEWKDWVSATQQDTNQSGGFSTKI
ncbi:flagellar hook-length control protein FliK [Paenibacillus sp. FSL P4-0338]|uniref:flagellar hook-length control protein FliK n=1 Tax=unclassified Paenibacillus TaxID=185978 RepID=UPI0003E20B98|nr:flagellar hook-length control protein FliK [Paenibacillus sp. FSL R7-269]ETT53667.1 flagellar hook-length control protein [Paenibacillus sp. FSL R7-269]